MKKIRTLIIDDEHLAREIIKTYLKDDSEIEIVGECDNGFDGLKAIQSEKPDLVFLDIMMPKLNGFEMLELIDQPPVIVFSTAYDQYAIKAFEQNAVDYLLKPYAQDRFLEPLKKAKQKINSEESQKQDLSALAKQGQEHVEELTRVAVRTGSKIDIIPVDKISYIEAMDDYVRLHTEEGKFLKQNTMKYYESHLPMSDFVRIHRSYIVRIKQISRLEAMEKDAHVALLHDGTQLSVSRSGYGRIKEVLGI
ncbi:MAG: response regulator [Cyclobacteriaceae bacterium]